MQLDDLKARAGGDYFALLDLPHRFAVDDALLKKHFLALSRATHPDFFSGDPEELGAIMAISAAVNDAYRTLEDPVRRAEYVLIAHGGKNAGQDKRVPPEMLAEALTLNEEIAQAKEAADASTLAAIREQMKERYARGLNEIERLAADLTADGDPTAKGDAGTLDALRLELNGMKYVLNLLGQLE